MHCAVLQFTPTPTTTTSHPCPPGWAEGWRHQPTRPSPTQTFKRRQGWREGGKVTGEPRQPPRRAREAPRLPAGRRGEEGGPGGGCPAAEARRGKCGARAPRLPARRCPSPSVSPPPGEGRRAGGAHSPRRGRRASGRGAAGPERGAARSGAPPPRRPRNAAPHRAMQPGQRHNTPRDIRRPAIGRRAEGRARQPFSGAVTPAAREGAAGAHTPRTHSHKDRRSAPRSV